MVRKTTGAVASGAPNTECLFIVSQTAGLGQPEPALLRYPVPDGSRKEVILRMELKLGGLEGERQEV